MAAALHSQQLPGASLRAECAIGPLQPGRSGQGSSRSPVATPASRPLLTPHAPCERLLHTQPLPSARASPLSLDLGLMSLSHGSCLVLGPHAQSVCLHPQASARSPVWSRCCSARSPRPSCQPLPGGPSSCLLLGGGGCLQGQVESPNQTCVSNGIYLAPSPCLCLWGPGAACTVQTQPWAESCGHVCVVVTA